MLRDAALDEAAAMVGVGDCPGGAFAVVERIAAAAGLVEQPGRFQLRPLGPDEDHAAVVLQDRKGSSRRRRRRWSSRFPGGCAFAACRWLSV